MNNKLFSIFDKYPNLFVGFSDKSEGNMKPTGSSFLDKKIFDNRDKFLRKLGIDKNLLVALNQVHGNKVLAVRTKEKGKLTLVADGFLTREKKLYLSIRAADCLPVYLFDPISKTIGIVHCGWRSISMGIIANVLTLARKELDLDISSTIVGIGPGICVNHFEVKENVAEKFENYPESVVRKNGKIFINLKAVAKRQLIESGVKEENIEVNPICTFEDKNYFSYRRDKPKYVEAMMTIIGLRN